MGPPLMSSPVNEAARKVVEDAIRSRTDEQKTYLAATVAAPLPVARADLIYLWDEHNTRYLDWASLGNPVGHQHPIITGAVAEHPRYYGHTAPQGRHSLRWPVQYAKDLSAQFTGQGEAPKKVLFTEGEREAVLQAVRLAQGTATGSAVLTVGGDYDWLPCARNYYPPVFDPADADWGRAYALLLNLADPQAHTMRPGAARRWILAAREAGKPVIVDESVTGFGRLGRMWGFEATGLVPDIIVLGGPAGGGYPLGAVVASPEIFEGTTIDVSGQAGNPVACCAGAATLTAINLGTLEYMSESDKVLSGGLDSLLSQFPHHLFGHHGWGHFRGLRLETFEKAERFVADALAEGLYLAPPAGNTVTLAPVLITSSGEISRTIDIMASVLLSWDEQ